MYLRTSRRRNKDGSVTEYYQLAHNERHPTSGNPVAKVIHSFGRVEGVDRAALARLVAFSSRLDWGLGRYGVGLVARPARGRRSAVIR